MQNLYRNNRNLQNLAEKLNISILNIKDVDQFGTDLSESNIELNESSNDSFVIQNDDIQENMEQMAENSNSQ